jgi:hypothetical protein
MGTTTASLKALLSEGSNLAAVKDMARSVRRARQDPRPPERADELAGIELLDHEGDEVRLGDYWRDRPAALVFLRHWG